MDIKTDFYNRPLSIGSSIGESQKASPDKDPQQGGVYTSYKNNEEQYESKVEEDNINFNTNYEKQLKSNSNDENFDISSFLGNIELQRSLSLIDK